MRREEGRQRVAAAGRGHKRKERTWDGVCLSSGTVRTGELSICVKTERKGLMGRLEVWSDGENGAGLLVEAASSSAGGNKRALEQQSGLLSGSKDLVWMGLLASRKERPQGAERLGLFLCLKQADPNVQCSYW